MDLFQEFQNLAKPKPVFDGCGDKNKENPIMDSASFDDADTRLRVAATIQQWLESCEDLEDGETCSDRLLMMMVGIVDANKDGKLDDDEMAYFDQVSNYASEYLSKKGVSDADISALLEDYDADAGQRVMDYLIAEMPEGDDADADMDDFAFEDQSAIFDASYKKVMAVRGGKKVRINKRITGAVQLSARQKIAIRKAQLKSHGAKAKMRRAKSMAVRQKSGM